MINDLVNINLSPEEKYKQIFYGYFVIDRDCIKKKDGSFKWMNF